MERISNYILAHTLSVLQFGHIMYFICMLLITFAAKLLCNSSSLQNECLGNFVWRKRNGMKYLRIKWSWLLWVAGLVWIMRCVRARWFANRTYKARKGLPVFYIQELAFRDLQSKQKCKHFLFWTYCFSLCREIRKYHFKKNNLRAPFPSPPENLEWGTYCSKLCIFTYYLVF